MGPVQLPWRTGGRRGRTIHVQLRADPSDADPFAGIMDTPELAAEAVFAHNAVLSVRPPANGYPPRGPVMAREPVPGLAGVPWRVGGFADLAVFAQAGSEPALADVIVCVAAAPEIAVLVCELHNAGLAVQPGTREVNRLIREHLAVDQAGGGRR